MEFWLQQTAWTMDKPKPYGIMHLSFFLGGMILAFFTAYLLRKLSVRKRNYLIFGIGVFLTLCEIFKQLFLYVIVNNYNYNWWYFPFQLCSVPMYLCLISPWIKRKTIRTAVFTFLMDFSLLGGIMAFLEPSGLLYTYVVLTLHSFIWHIILVFLSCIIGFSEEGELSLKGFQRGLPVWGITVFLAMLFNVLFHTYGNINMFYINPYKPCPQIFFNKIAEVLGNWMGILIYLLCMLLGAFVCHSVFYWFHKWGEHHKQDKI